MNDVFLMNAVDTMVQPLIKVKSVKKRTNRFKRHQSDRKIAVKVSDCE